MSAGVGEDPMIYGKPREAAVRNFKGHSLFLRIRNYEI
jgi:hypothetical protein